MIWKEISNDVDMRAEILAKIKKEEAFLMAGNLEREKNKRLVTQEITMKVWKEKETTIDLI